MTKDEKIQFVKELTEKLKEYPNFYIADSGGMTVAQVNNLRRLCFESNVPMQVIKNSLIKKAMENLGADFSEAYGSLKYPSSVFFATAENPSVPAKLLRKFRKTSSKPILKAAIIDTAVFIGDDQLQTLTELKSKDQLIGEIVGLLQSPAKNVVSALQSGGNKLAGIIKTLSERDQ
ncbi:MAG: 50S ribosomal protein L10 [Bacteroidia bacterium]|nr:50S ribosomal protein L10 [Bacteroidia bacterium]